MDSGDFYIFIQPVIITAVEVQTHFRFLIEVQKAFAPNLQCWYLVKFHVIEGQNRGDQIIIRDRRYKCARSDCILNIPFFLGEGQTNAGDIVMCQTCRIATWRLALQAPVVANAHIQ